MVLTVLEPALPGAPEGGQLLLLQLLFQDIGELGEAADRHHDLPYAFCRRQVFSRHGTRGFGR